MATSGHREVPTGFAATHCYGGPMGPHFDLETDPLADMRHRKLVRAVVVVGIGYCLAYGISLFVIESVMGSGPLLAAAGLWTARQAWLHPDRSPPGLLLGVGVVVLSLTLLLAVNLFSWSPNDAKAPFAAVGAVAGILILILSMLAVRPRRQTAPVLTLDALSHTPHRS